MNDKIKKLQLKNIQNTLIQYNETVFRGILLQKKYLNTHEITRNKTKILFKKITYKTLFC